jgi:cytochrome c biogenesis protein CcdA
MLLGAVVAGASICVLALMPAMLRQRRESMKQKAAIRALQAAAGQSAPVPQPDSIAARQ